MFTVNKVCITRNSRETCYDNTTPLGEAVTRLSASEAETYLTVIAQDYEGRASAILNQQVDSFVP